MSGHTPEPWRARKITSSNGQYVLTDGEKHISLVPRENDARRIIACVNACEGIDDEVLEGARRGIDVFKRQIAELESERDQYKRLSDALTEAINDPEGRLATLQKQRDELLATVESLRSAAMMMMEMIEYKFGDYLTANEARSIEFARNAIKEASHAL